MSIWPILLINLNLPPHERVKQENLICVGFIPDGAKHLDSFFFPLIQTFASWTGMQTILIYLLSMLKIILELCIVIDLTSDVVSSGTLAFGTGDLPAVSAMLGIRGHTAKCHCRYCLIEGIPEFGKPRSAQYFPLQFPSGQQFALYNKEGANIGTARSTKHYQINDIVNPTSWLARTPEKFKEAHDTIESMKSNPTISKSDLEKYQKKTGINGKTVLTLLPSMIPPQCFPLDTMHLIMLNIFWRMFLLWSGNFFKSQNGVASFTEEYELSGAIWTKIGDETENHRSSLPLSFGSPCRDINKHWRGYKAEEWQNWML